MPSSLMDLPQALITEISQYLSVKDLFHLNSTAKFFRQALNKVLITKLQAQQIKQIVSGTLFLQQDGSVWACGNIISDLRGMDNLINQSSLYKVPLDNVKQMVIGNCTFFLQTDGTVWACGYNYQGELGIGSDNHYQRGLRKVLVDNVKEVLSAGSIITYFLKKDGSVWACGNNTCGQLGIGNKKVQNSPYKVPLEDVKKVWTDGNSTYFLKKDGSVWACGNNEYGQLGIGNMINQSSPQKVLIENVEQVVITSCNSVYFIKNDGSVWGCGNNYRGQLGIGNNNAQNSPCKVPLDHVKQVESRSDSLFFLKTDGSVWACGNNECGQLGIGNLTHQNSLQQVPLDHVKHIVFPPKGRNPSTYFLKDDGSVWACGFNQNGQLGIGNYNFQRSPQKVLLDNVKQVVMEVNTPYFLKKDGSVWVVHKGNHSPVKMPLDNVKTIEAGGLRSFFIKNDGSVWACGNNEQGELGLGHKNPVSDLQPVPRYYQLQVILQQFQEKNNQTQAQITQMNQRTIKLQNY